MPQQWRNAKKRKKKKKKQGEEGKPILEPVRSPASPRPEDCMSDDEVTVVKVTVLPHELTSIGKNYLVKPMKVYIVCNVKWQVVGWVCKGNGSAWLSLLGGIFFCLEIFSVFQRVVQYCPRTRYITLHV